MVRKKRHTSTAVIALLVIIAGGFCLPMVAQSNESLGDAARHIRAEKNKPVARQSESVPTGGQTLQAAIGQSQKDAESWGDLVVSGEQAMYVADYVSAETFFRKSVSYAEQHNLGLSRIAQSNNSVGWSLRAQRKYAEAEVLHRSALQALRSAYPENDESVAHSKAGLGIALVGLGRYPEAEGVLMESLNAYHEQPRATLCALSFPLDGLTMLYKSNHQYSKGERIYTEVFSLMTADRGTPCENFVSLLDHLAELYADDNQWDRVQEIQQGRAGLALGMKGPHSRLYGDALYAMAATLRKRSRFEEAAGTYAQAAEAYRHSNPPLPAKMAASLESEEISLQLAGKTDEAKQIHPAVLAAVEEMNAGESQGEMMRLRSRAVEAWQKGDMEEAAKLTARELAVSQKLSAGVQMIALSDSAMINEEQHKAPEAEADLKRILELSIASTGAASHATARAHVELGRFYSMHNRLREAEESYAAALALFGAHDTGDLRNVLVNLGALFLMDSKFDRAEATYQRALKLAQDTHDDAGMCAILQSLTRLYQKSNRPNDAEAAITRALNISAQLPRPMNRQWVNAAMTAAWFYEQSGHAQQAEQLYGQVIVFFEQEIGTGSPALRLPLGKLIALLKSQGRVAEAAKYEARRDRLPQMPTIPGMAE